MPKKASVIIQILADSSYHHDSVKIGVENVEFVLAPNFRYTSQHVKTAGGAKWKFECDSGLLIDFSALLGKQFSCVFLEAGDSLFVRYMEGHKCFTGSGASKLTMIEEWAGQISNLAMPKSMDKYHVKSVDDFWDWNTYLSRQQDAMKNVLESYKGMLSPLAFRYIKANELANLEYRKLLRYEILVNGAKKYGISQDSLDLIFDREFHTPVTNLLSNYEGWIRTYVYYYSYVRMQVLKAHRYNWEDPFLKSINRKALYVQMAKQQYQGHPLQSFLTFLLTNSGLKEHTLKVGYAPEIDSLLCDFYSLPGYFQYKAYVKAYEAKISRWVSGSGYYTYNFELKDEAGNVVKRSDFEGKILLLHFWTTNDQSREMSKSIQPVYETFQHDSNWVYVRISSARNKAASTKGGKPRSAQRHPIDLYIDEKDTITPVLKAFNVIEYPSLFLINENGQSLYNQTFFSKDQSGDSLRFPDPRKDKARALINRIQEELTWLGDGPYIYQERDSFRLELMNSRRRIVKMAKRTTPFEFETGTDEYQKKMKIRLIDTVKAPPSTYKAANKILVISDIEGNLKAFKRLLIANNVIDQHLNWRYGDGHLVFNGDMFDRGKQVTECLWLIYSLEQKARQLGGTVHFILGNHEFMNLTGDTRYMDKKYKRYLNVAGMQSEQYMDINSELGRWLRSKNIVEKIGSLLFVHGGISPEINGSELSIDSLNAVARHYLHSPSEETSLNQRDTELLFDANVSPFWYRGYYQPQNDSTIIETLQKTSEKFGISTVITGHTIIADTITAHFDGKLINVDTHHAGGHSEALLVEGNQFFRVSTNGIKKELFDNSTPVAIK